MLKLLGFGGNKTIKPLKAPKGTQVAVHEHIKATLGRCVTPTRGRGRERALFPLAPVPTSHPPQSHHPPATCSGDLRAAVKLPPGEDENEWIATHVVDFFNSVSLLYGSVADDCTPTTCPIMSAGPRYQYLSGPPAHAKPTSVSLRS